MSVLKKNTWTPTLSARPHARTPPRLFGIAVNSAGLIQTKPLISEVIALEQVIDRGFARMMAPTKDVFRILVSPTGQP